ncbi:MAG: hypothetical protein AAF587_29560 [Bacteroidota bacterium]
MLKLPFLLLQQRLSEMSQLPDVRWFNAQFDQNKDEAVFYVPSVYIEFLPMDLEDIGEQVQGGEVMFRIHLMTELYDDNDRVLAHFDLVDDIFKHLHGWDVMKSALPEFSALQDTEDDVAIINKVVRTRLIPDHAQSNTIITVQEFKTYVADFAAMKSYIEFSPTITVLR